MKNDKEFEMLLNEIPHATSSFNLLHPHHQHQQHHGMYGMFDDDPSSRHHQQQQHQKYNPVSPVSGFNLQSEGSSSSLVSGSGWFSSDDGSSPRPSSMLDDLKPQTSFMRTPYLKSPDDSPMGRNSIENLMNGMSKMHFRDEIEDSLLTGYSSPDYNNVEENRVFESYRNGFSSPRRVNDSFPLSINEDRTSALLRLQQNRLNEERSRAWLQQNQNCGDVSFPMSANESRGSAMLGLQHCWDYGKNLSDTRNFQRQTREETLTNLQLQADYCLGRNYYDTHDRLSYTTPSQVRPSMNDSFLYPRQNLMYSADRGGVPNLRGSHVAQSEMPLGMESQMPYCFPLFNERVEAGRQATPPSSPSVESAMKLEAFNCEDSIIIQGKGLHYVIKKRRERSKEQRNENGIAPRNCETGCTMSMYSPLSIPLTYNSLADIRDYIYFMAKDQHGCRFLQQKFEEGSPQDKQVIFQQIIDHVVELMTNPFGNYLVQKLLEKCNAEQRMKVLLMVTRIPGELVRISLSMHGTRAVQKLINTLKSRDERSVVISALEPGFLDLIKDLNGNHVLQHCLQHLPNEESKFIFTSAAKFCFDIATHRHGCCVLQRCIAYARGEDREILVSKVSSNGLRLAQDAFGNYVVQFVLELKIPSANASLMSQFEGRFVSLSTQKFSSNVIEKCLKVFGEDGRSLIINELISSPQFEILLQDPYANYVVQSALRVSKGPLNDALVEAIRPYTAILKTNPFCKKIISWTCSKK